ncbi:MAG TPA: deoxyribodipyrimidine photolyase [Rhodospirillaceae bacterium]|nr:MAG: deoxyribodipyrimidine photolyase [Alphaproteobacteria bacterium GWF2_58_20]HAU29402.1 deoxyribodipyrimidine photolyase [Rhodospirillaceae bacterium]
MTSIAWFTNDLRLADNPMLAMAAASGPVIPLFILDDESPGPWKTGGASRWWLHHSLKALASSLAALGAPLILRRGPAPQILADLVRETGAKSVFTAHMVEPWARQRLLDCGSALRETSAALHTTPGNLLLAPGTISTASGNPFRVFTPFYRKCAAQLGILPLHPTPTTLVPPSVMPSSDPLSSWSLVPTTPDWAFGFGPEWKPGEAGAATKLESFISDGMATYPETRDRPDFSGTSRLSPHIAHGEISIRQVWNAAGDAAGSETFHRELLWREFCQHLLFHFPHIPESPLNPRFENIPWQMPENFLAAWQQGKTGYPIVDAGMRQLWKTGFMHNRVRMIAASFLVKDGLVSWTLGEKWFWDTLVDADLANNAASWQWVAGCGADAAPFFRIFNPMTQGQRFDPDGLYIRRWIPELSRLPTVYIHAPWQAPADILEASGIVLGETYPNPVIDHAEARKRALALFRGLPEAQTRKPGRKT